MLVDITGATVELIRAAWAACKAAKLVAVEVATAAAEEAVEAAAVCVLR